MPQNELLDRIFECFNQHRYWPFQTLKQRLEQPEAYLKQVLEMVAHMIKQGELANKWELRPECRPATYANANAESAPDPDAFDESSDEDSTAMGGIAGPSDGVKSED